MENEQKKMSKCCAEPVREAWGAKLLVTKGNIQKVATFHYECSFCGLPCEATYLVRNQYGVWETDKRNGRPQDKPNSGRPTELTEENVKKLKEAFSYDCSISETCLYIGISRQTFYNWKEKNPELFDELEELRAHPLLKARKTVVDSLETDKGMALSYLERKSKAEFAPSATIKTEGSLEVKQTDPTLEEAIKKLPYEEQEKILNAINGQ